MLPVPGRWNVLGSSVVGTSHLERNFPCQDASASIVLPDQTLIIAVADGAGSASRSEEGAVRAVHSSLNYLSIQLETHKPEDEEQWRVLLESTLKQVRTAVETLAGDGELRELGSTLLLVVATEEWLVTLQLGDGGIVSRDSTGGLQVLTIPGDSEYINETSFITSNAYLSEAHYSARPASDVNAVAVFTDGIQFIALRYADNTAHPPFFDPLFEFVAQPNANANELNALLTSDRLNQMTDDDKTLVLAVRA